MDEYFMRLAIEEAVKAYNIEEVPVGAIVVKDDAIISKAFNMRETLNDATAHAEVLAVQRACTSLSSWRLLDCTLYVTVEPCPMCAGALVNARVKRIVYGISDLKGGACGSIINIANNPSLNHRIEITGGILEDECKKLMQDFFKKRRNK